MQLKFDMGRFVSSSGRVDGADVDLKILLEDVVAQANKPLVITRR